MDLPPTIPTSFVPRPSASTRSGFHLDFTGTYGFIAYGVFVIVFALAISVFIYGRILLAEKTSKDAALVKAESSIDSATVIGFVRLRDRLTSGQTLLQNHVALTGFLAALEALLPSSVRFTSLHVTIDDARKAKLEGTGTAKSFNALAAASTAFAADGRIRGAIFSNIVVNKDDSVSFVISATIDQKAITFTPTP